MCCLISILESRRRSNAHTACESIRLRSVSSRSARNGLRIGPWLPGTCGDSWIRTRRFHVHPRPDVRSTFGWRALTAAAGTAVLGCATPNRIAVVVPPVRAVPSDTLKIPLNDLRTVTYHGLQGGLYE